MRHATYLILRGEIFHFRRRLPGSAATTLQISLWTSDRNEAARMAARINFEIESMLERLAQNKQLMPQELIAKYFDFCVKRLVAEISTRHRMAMMSADTPSITSQAADIRRKVVSFMLEDGLSRTLPPHRLGEFSNALELEIALDQHEKATAYVQVSQKLPPYKAAASSILGTTDPNSLQLDQLREAFLFAYSAALEALEKKPGEMANAAMAHAQFVVSAQNRASFTNPHLPHAPEALPPSAQKSPVATILPSANTPLLTTGLKLISGNLTYELLDLQFASACASQEQIDRSPKSDPFSFDLAGVCERSIRRAKESGKMDSKTADARRSSIKLFAFVTGLQLVTEIEQHHIAVFTKALKTIPKNFNRSVHDRRRTYSEIVAIAASMPPEELGREPGTVNRHLDTIGAILDYARVQDKISIDRDIDTAPLRAAEIKRARDKRNAFRREDVINVFSHPIWQGCQSDTRRQIKGNTIKQDGLFWVPLIVHYSGARLEEIAALPVEAILPAADSFGFDIRPHEERRLKNLQSERLIPIHGHLIELGLLEHRQLMRSRGEVYLFPELRPNSSKAPFGKSIKYNWDKALLAQLRGNSRKLSMHSLRHYVNGTLMADRSIPRDVRLDILGHAAVDLNEEVYSEGAEFSEKERAINTIPRAF